MENVAPTWCCSAYSANKIDMKIAIHHNQHSFSTGWITYCKENAIEYKLVNCYDSDIVEQVRDCDILVWHHHNANHKDKLFSKQLLFALEHSGKKVFPDFHTSWHFDDKIGQKYLIESLGIPAPTSYVFYSKSEALEWIDNTTFPKVFKLRGGAGSENVELILNKAKAKKYVKKAFGRGFRQFDSVRYLQLTFKKFRDKKSSALDVVKAIVRLFISTEYSRKSNKEKNYIYFQDYIANNDSDIRVVVTGDRAFAIKRMVRRGDFRASGSGRILFDRQEIDLRCIKIGFEANRKIKAQSIAYDFVFDEMKNPLVVEISYGYEVDKYLCPGFWDSSLVWHEGKIDPTGWIIQNLLNRNNIEFSLGNESAIKSLSLYKK